MADESSIEAEGGAEKAVLDPHASTPAATDAGEPKGPTVDADSEASAAKEKEQEASDLEVLRKLRGREKALPPAHAAQERQEKGAAAPAHAEPADSSEAIEYGLESKAFQALRQTHKLPELDAWEQMDAAAKRELLRGAREELAEKTRQYQQSRSTPPAQAEREDRDAGTGRPDVKTSPGAQPGRRTVLDQAIAKVREQLGDDIAAPIASALMSQDTAIAEIQKSVGLLADRRKGEISRMLVQKADEARTLLAKDMPQIGYDDELWHSVHDSAIPFAKSLVDERTGEVDPDKWNQLLVRHGRGLLFDNIRQLAQRDLAGKSRASMARQPVPPGRTRSNAKQSLTVEQSDHEVLRLMRHEGLTPAEAKRRVAELIA